LATPLQKRFPFGSLTIWSAWVWAVSWLAFALAPNPLILGVAVAISFIIAPIFDATQLSYRLIVTPDQMLGRINGIFRLVTFGSLPIGVMITGVLIKWTGPAWAVMDLFSRHFIAVLAS